MRELEKKIFVNIGKSEDIKEPKSGIQQGIEALKKDFGQGVDNLQEIEYIGKCAVKRAVHTNAPDAP